MTYFGEIIGDSYVLCDGDKCELIWPMKRISAHGHFQVPIKMNFNQTTLPCFFHLFKLPTSGTISMNEKSLYFQGIHVNNDRVEKEFLFSEIESIEKGIL